MKAGRTLLPGQPGTKKLVEQYGQDLVCVRYRYDADQNISFKTIELIIQKAPLRKRPHSIPPNKIVHVRIDYREPDLVRTAKAAGAKWNRQKKLWALPYKNAVAIGLSERIVPDNEGA